MLQLRTILPHTLELLRSIQDLPCAQDTRLVGGTALALQYGHRQPVDLDFYGRKYPEHSDFRALMSPSYFEDADEQIPPLMFGLPDWEHMKRFIQHAVDEFQ